MVLLILPITVIGWLPDTIVAFFIINDENKKKAIQEALDQCR